MSSADKCIEDGYFAVVLPDNMIFKTPLCREDDRIDVAAMLSGCALAVTQVPRENVAATLPCYHPYCGYDKLLGCEDNCGCQISSPHRLSVRLHNDST